jgi:hypothetical protein
MSTTAPSPGAGTTEGTRRRDALAAFSALIALSAYAGGIGLVTGFLSLAVGIERRLPFGSPAFAGIALALIVALPATGLAWLAHQDDRRTDAAAFVMGVVLVGWILVELAFLREVSFFHPTYLIIGLVLMGIGRHGRHDLRRLVRHP